MSIDELFARPSTDGLTLEEIQKILTPYFPITRPPKLKNMASVAVSQINISPEVQARLDELKARGGQFSFLKK